MAQHYLNERCLILLSLTNLLEPHLHINIGRVEDDDGEGVAHQAHQGHHRHQHPLGQQVGFLKKLWQEKEKEDFNENINPALKSYELLNVQTILGCGLVVTYRVCF